MLQVLDWQKGMYLLMSGKGLMNSRNGKWWQQATYPEGVCSAANLAVEGLQLAAQLRVDGRPVAQQPAVAALLV